MKTNASALLLTATCVFCGSGCASGDMPEGAVSATEGVAGGSTSNSTRAAVNGGATGSVDNARTGGNSATNESAIARGTGGNAPAVMSNGGTSGLGGATKSGAGLGKAGAAVVGTGGAPVTAGASSAATNGGASNTAASSRQRPGTAGSGKGGAPAAGGMLSAAGRPSPSAAGRTSSVTGGTTSTGGATTAGGAADPGSICPLPTKFKWTTSAALAKVPRTIGGHNVIAIKDFTDVITNGKHVVYATAYEGGWKSAMFTFTDWADWDASAGTWFSKNAVAPTLIYFTPKKTWVLTYQWGFQYATSDDPTDVSMWSTGKSLLSGGPDGAIDQTVICDTTNCYLFFAGDNGNIYRSEMPIGNFPGTFNGYKTIMTDTQANLFEAVEVYALKGLNQYLMIVEAMGSGGRYFRAFTSTSLGGSFTALSGASTEASPFAGKNNVTGTLWSNDISHGDMVRTDPSETQTVDPCNLQFLYQGYDKTKSSSDYGTIPYQPGLLTLQR